MFENGRVPILSGKEFIKLLSNNGFYKDRCSGNHFVMKKDDKTIVVPYKNKDMNRQMTLRLLKDAGLWNE